MGDPTCVIVGAGIAGAALAYRLAPRFGSVTVLDQGRWPATGGATSHAPGGLSAGAPGSAVLTRLAAGSRRMYSEVGAMDAIASLRVARTPATLRRLRHEVAEWGALGLKGVEMISAAEAAARHPLLSADAIVGACWIPSSHYGRANGTGAVEALMRKAINAGASIRGGKVSALTRLPGGRWRVGCDGGWAIEADHVVVCAGAWSAHVAALAQIRLPVAAVRHPYTVSGPIDTLERRRWPDGASSHMLHEHQAFPTSLPGVWDPDAGLYYQQFGDRIGVGSYDHPAQVVLSADAERRSAGLRNPARYPFQAGLHARAAGRAAELLPALQRAPAGGHSFEGLMTYAPDGVPVVGPHPTEPGLWFDTCVYVWHAGGAADMLANWMISGIRPEDGAALDPARLFGGDELTDRQLAEAVGRVYESRMSEHRMAEHASLIKPSLYYFVMGGEDSKTRAKAATGVPVYWRDSCANLLVELNKCRRESL